MCRDSVPLQTSQAVQKSHKNGKPRTPRLKSVGSRLENTKMPSYEVVQAHKKLSARHVKGNLEPRPPCNSKVRPGRATSKNRGFIVYPNGSFPHRRTHTRKEATTGQVTEWCSLHGARVRPSIVHISISARHCQQWLTDWNCARLLVVPVFASGL